MKKEFIPKTDSIQKLAHFWDTHDLTDFEGELEEVKSSVFEKNIVLRIHLQRDEAESVMKIAESKRISYDDLIRQWVIERTKKISGNAS
ncbi:MAG: BrnA antitoxin family protein [Candidatus Scalindua sp.]|nr:BrnA antitoxin family protein [Candidatus Scalindua sp.]MCR4345168.1 BrnA antitoxin family protein [Candidatus Scalindua sp.]